MQIPERDVVKDPSILVRKSRDFDVARARAQIKGVRKLFVYGIKYHLNY